MSIKSLCRTLLSFVARSGSEGVGDHRTLR